LLLGNLFDVGSGLGVGGRSGEDRLGQLDGQRYLIFVRPDRGETRERKSKRTGECSGTQNCPYSVIRILQFDLLDAHIERQLSSILPHRRGACGPWTGRPLLPKTCREPDP